MAANTDPRFAATSELAMGQVSIANTFRDGTGDLTTILTGVADGTIIEMVRVVATGATTAGVVRLFLFDGTNTHLLKEILVSAVTPSTTTEVFTAEYIPTKPLILPSASWQLKASTENSETFNIFAFASGLTG